MVNFLLGWLVVSVFGTLLALRLIRNGRHRPARKTTKTETVVNADPGNNVILPPDDPGIHPRAGH
ncbi:hypothetical protein [Pseudomonas folii]|uniref:Uncharacterized protein n=1 Tax=Pseudomonas folii TaxID=2762593 RepID=A0ABR7AU68_9PSED|nr:hypothetical protein [Pseudomonas folii]MBC3948275.1 hypothetical protein [Pseudomonas folii]